MIEVNKYFLKTGISQKATAKLLVDKLKPMLDECVYNEKRYHCAQISLILLHTYDDISNIIIENKRLTDVNNTIKIKDSYFNFVFLPFTDLQDSYSLINHIEYNVSVEVKVLSAASAIEAETFSYYNFINYFLDDISGQNEGNVLTY